MNQDPIILCIDSSTDVCTVAIGTPTECWFAYTNAEAGGQHSSLLAPAVEQALEVLRQRGGELSAIGIGAGPGSYTGLRIGSSIAKGLAMGLSIPLIAISTLHLLAYSYILHQPNLPEDAIITPMIDARRMEVYTASFSAKGERLSPDTPLVLDEYSWSEDRKQRHCIGNGATKAISLWTEVGAFAPDLFPTAQDMLHLAHKAFQEQDFVDIAYWTPNYLKDYVAVVAKNKVLGR